MKIISTKKYRYLLKNIIRSAEKSGIDCSEICFEQKTFPDSEIYLKIQNPEEIRNAEIAFIAGAIDFHSVFEIYNFACVLISSGCSKLQIVIPYLAYSTMEKAKETGEIIIVKNIARLLSNIPQAPSGTHVYLIEPHSEEIPQFFENNANVSVISTEKIIMKIVKFLIKTENSVILASADMGRKKIIHRLGEKLNLDRALLVKKRLSPEKTEIISQINANVSEKTVIIYDDMIRTASSLLGAAKYYKDYGAKKIIAIVTHGLFVRSSFEKLQNSGLIEKIYCMNTYPNPGISTKSSRFFELIDISDLITEKIFF